jgi:glycosyltransferase involved in cell wall biosynthesis
VIVVSALEVLFWLGASVAVYTYVGYPFLLGLVSRLVGKPWQVAPFRTSVSIVLAVHNEEGNLPRRLNELTSLIDASGLPGEVVVVSDGSTDCSEQAARAFESRGVRVFALEQNLGKAAALSRGAREARNELLLFADARQRWADDALVRLTENFADPSVGAVSGDLVLENVPGVMAGVDLYWRFEKWLRKTESKTGSQVGVTGAISAVRRELFPPEIPLGTLLDDVYWPLTVAMKGYRVVHDERARAFDRLPDRPSDEFLRKVRTLAGNFQLVWLLPTSLLPWRNPVWPAWISHKLLRLLVPWAMLVMLACSVFLDDTKYRVFLAAQLVAYCLGMLGLIPAVGGRFKPLGAAASLLVLNAAAWLGFWVWISGRAGRTWRKADYAVPVGADKAKEPRP